MKFIAHRGLTSRHNPENSEEAILVGTKHLKVDGVELDVRLTKDNQVVVFHDEQIDRMVENGSGFVSNILLKDLQKYNIGRTTKHIMIPTLEAVLNKVDDGAFLLIELKDEGSRNKILSDKVLDIISNYPNITFYLQSFNEDIVRYLLDNSTYIVGILVNKNNTDLLELNANFYSVSQDVLMKNKSILDAGKEVFVWTIDSKDDLRKIKRLSDDVYIITNVPLKLQTNFLGF